MASLLVSVASALNKFGHGDRMNAPRVLKLIEPTGLSIAVSTGLSERSKCVEALFKLLGSEAFRKDEEIGLVIGEALALFGEAYSTAESDSSSETDTDNWPLDMDETFGRSLSPPAQVRTGTMQQLRTTREGEKKRNLPCLFFKYFHLKVIYTLLRTARSTSNNHKRRGCAPALLAVVARATRLELNSNLRKWLQRTLHEIQDCFLFLLTDSKSNQLSRESCCLGLAACNKIVVASESEELKGRLLRSFGSTTNHGGSAMQETAEQASQRRRADGTTDTGSSEQTTGIDVGGAGGVSEAALGAYREMASAAVASGRPDILYSMLILSVSHSIWFSTERRRDAYGSSSLQGNNFNNGEVKTALRPFLSKLLPRILRASNE
jgi:proteasome component ECM29